MNTRQSLQTANEKLEKLHIRLTPLRYAILERLHAAPERPSVEELCRQLAPRFPKLNATAVRNAVLVFEKMGLLPAADRRSA
ncbi:hypothetical protein MO973_42505 [Paenibacillus sp. TRM 82003]|nr:hypothetical protein [Paenibacillus sp. TRM 82003]